MAEKSVNVRIKGKAVDQLEELREKREATSGAEVVKNALRIYKALEVYREEDGSIVIERPDGKRVRLVLP